MSEKEKNAFAAITAAANERISAGDEGTVLAITASYLAGKEAGKREALSETQCLVDMANILAPKSEEESQPG